MWTCPICNKKNEDRSIRCSSCGYDISCNYEQYASLSPLLSGDLSSVGRKKQDRIAGRYPHAFTCQKCGGSSFLLLPEEQKIVCTSCEAEQSLENIPGMDRLSLPKDDDLIAKQIAHGVARILLEKTLNDCDDLDPSEVSETSETSGTLSSSNDFTISDPASSSEISTEEAEAQLYFSCKAHLARNAPPAIAGGVSLTLARQKNGRVAAVGNDSLDYCTGVSEWRDIIGITANGSCICGLKADGTAVTIGYSECDFTKEKDIKAVAFGLFHTLVLKSDGTVKAFGDNDAGQCNVESWKEIIAISSEMTTSIGLRKDGTVAAVGALPYVLSSWKDIIAIASGNVHTAGLKKDGTVVAAGSNNFGECDVSGWRDIVAIAAGGSHTVGLKANGRVVAVGADFDGRCSTSEWKEIIAIAAGDCYTIGLKADGTVVAVGNNTFGQCNVSSLKDIEPFTP